MARATRVMRFLLTAATIAVCLLLCWQAIDIYLTGNSPDNFSAPGVRIAPVYSREIVGERLAAISPALFLYLALVVAGLALQAAGGGELKRPSPFRAEQSPTAPAVGERTLPALRIALYAAAIVLIVLGVMNGGLWDVLVKAVNICTECIGLG
ncbi:MAG: hypothetical protein HDT35_06160 [Clostridiales bacterium]|nr:hypothetical protein [Clostridiales bacterium]